MRAGRISCGYATNLRVQWVFTIEAAHEEKIICIYKYPFRQDIKPRQMRLGYPAVQLYSHYPRLIFTTIHQYSSSFYHHTLQCSKV